MPSGACHVRDAHLASKLPRLQIDAETSPTYSSMPRLAVTYYRFALTLPNMEYRQQPSSKVLRAKALRPPFLV